MKYFNATSKTESTFYDQQYFMNLYPSFRSTSMSSIRYDKLLVLNKYH